MKPSCARRRRPAAALTIVESLMAMVVVEVGVFAVSLALNAGRVNAQQADDAMQAVAHAETLIERILTLPYTDPDGPSSPGPEAGETDPAHFDNADDYHGHTDAAAGSSCTVTAAYGAEYVDDLTSSIPGLTITVTVRGAGRPCGDPVPRGAFIMTRRGLTLVELLLALAITAMVGAAAAAMVVSTSQSTTSLTDARRLSVKHQVVADRLGAAIRSSSMVLGHDDSSVVLWASDTRPNGLPNLSELRRIEWDDDGSELWFYAPPPDLSEAADTQYGPSDDFLSITWTLMDTARFPGKRWGTGVIAWSPTVEETAAGTALVSYELTIDADGTTRTQTRTVAVRSR